MVVGKKKISAATLREYWDNIKLSLKGTMEKAGIQEGLGVQKNEWTIQRQKGGETGKNQRQKK